MPRTLLSILADLNNAVVWMISIRPVISKFSHPCTNPLVTVPSAPITIGITVTFMLHRFILFSSKVYIFITLFPLLKFYPVISRNSKVYCLAVSLFCWLSLGMAVWPRLGDLFLSQIPKNYYYYYTLCEVFTHALTSGFSLKSERDQIFPGLQDSSQYSSLIWTVLWSKWSHLHFTQSLFSDH